MEPTVLISIAVAVLLVVLGSALFFIMSKFSSPQAAGGKRGNTFLLTGQMNSGKTALFYYLKTGQLIDSVTSLQPNSAEFTPACPSLAKTAAGKKIRHIYDLPGHGVFLTSIPKILPTLNTIIFTIDSTSISTIPAAAQTLYFYLTNLYIINTKIPIILTLTKTDSPSTLPVSVIKAALEVELEKIRKANSATKQLDSIGSENPFQAVQKLPNSQFSFETTPVPVQWASISVKNSNVDDLNAVFV